MIAWMVTTLKKVKKKIRAKVQGVSDLRKTVGVSWTQL
jgi:hypothetical protein